MKRFVCIVLAACLMLAATGCWGGNDSSSSSKPSNSATPAPSTSAGSSMGGSDTTDGAGGSQGQDGVMSGAMSGAMSGVDGAMSGAESAMSGAMSGAASSGTTNSSSASKAAAAQAAAPAEGDWSLRLVNAQNPLPEDFSVQTKSIPGYDDRMFDARAAGALEEMLAAAQQAGCPIYLVSAYRSVARQKALYTRKVNYYKAQGMDQQQAEAEAAKLVARPGESEHNLGLAADLVSADWYQHNDDLTEAFAETEQFRWLQKNAAQYGFILRYPKGKEGLTGVAYEPWHYRYVGPTAAAKISAAGQCLEEYVKA